jgi:hypothetical protein
LGEFPGGGLVIQSHSCFGEFLLPFMQKMVINKARVSELNSQAFGLLRCWVQAEFIGFSDEHIFILALMFYHDKEINAGVLLLGYYKLPIHPSSLLRSIQDEV